LRSQTRPPIQQEAFPTRELAIDRLASNTFFSTNVPVRWRALRRLCARGVG
jgi:hypothetical protein